MPKLNLEDVAVKMGTTYPAPFDQECNHKQGLRLSEAGGLTQFGAHIVIIPPAKSGQKSWSSQRHAHSTEDEFVYVLSGEGVLVDDSGETPLSAGDVCTHKAGDGNAHHIQNRSNKEIRLLVVGTRSPQTDHCRYPDIDLDLPATGKSARVFQHNDGTPY